MYLTEEQSKEVENNINGIVSAYSAFPQSLVMEDKGVVMPKIAVTSDIDGMDYKEGTIRTRQHKPDIVLMIVSSVRNDLQDICSGKIDCTEYVWSNQYGLDVDDTSITIRLYYKVA